MKKYLIFLLMLFFVQPAFSDDTEIYGVSTINVKPNVLIVFDNSGSMSAEDIPSEQYDPETTYPSAGYSSNAVYIKTGWGWFGRWEEYYDDISSTNWTCSDAKSALTSKGYWDGALSKDGDTVNCGGSTDASYRLGNFLNFDEQASDYEIRIVVTKKVIAELIYEFGDKINFGVMTFNSGNGGRLVESCGLISKILLGLIMIPIL